MNFQLRELFEKQDEMIEHKLPNWNGTISYLTEAAGDIYREFSHSEFIDYNYIKQKMRYLDDIKTLNISDIRELKSTIIRYPLWYDELDKYILKVDKLRDLTTIFDFDVYKYRKDVMIQTLYVIIFLCLYAKDEIKVKDVISEIDILNLMIEKSYNISKIT